MKNTDTETIDRYLCLSVSDCKRLGYLKKNTVTTGSVVWTQGAEQVGSIWLTVGTGAAPFARLRYSYRGVPVEASISLRFKPSNLVEGTGYYYFVCPITGLCCRKLYLVEGRFISRAAFRPLYEQQAQSKYHRSSIYLALRLMEQLEDMEKDRHRRLYYRGKPTPFGRRYEKLCDRFNDVSGELLSDELAARRKAQN